MSSEMPRQISLEMPRQIPSEMPTQISGVSEADAKTRRHSNSKRSPRVSLTLDGPDIQKAMSVPNVAKSPPGTAPVFQRAVTEKVREGSRAPSKSLPEPAPSAPEETAKKPSFLRKIVQAQKIAGAFESAKKEAFEQEKQANQVKQAEQQTPTSSPSTGRVQRQKTKKAEGLHGMHGHGMHRNNILLSEELTNLPIFKNCSEMFLAELCATVHSQSYAPGHVVVEEGFASCLHAPSYERQC